MEDKITKKCTKCGEVKLDEFYIYEKRECKCCCIKRITKYQSDRKEKIAKYKKEYAIKNKLKILAYNREYSKQPKNREKKLKRAKQYYLENIDKMRELGRIRGKEHYHKNIEVMRIRNRINRIKNRKKILITQKKYRDQNRSELRRKEKENSDNLSNCYVKHVLTSKSALCYADIPKELIESKREEIKAIRYMRRIENGEKST